MPVLKVVRAQVRTFEHAQTPFARLPPLVDGPRSNLLCAADLFCVAGTQDAEAHGHRAPLRLHHPRLHPLDPLFPALLLRFPLRIRRL